MTVVVKPAGADLFTDQQRDVRRGVIEAGHVVLGRAISAAKNQVERDAMQELASLPDVRSLTAREYREVKRHAISLVRRAGNPKP
jgi:hypothetical protein